MFDELCGVDVCHQHGSHEGLVDFLHEGDRSLAVASDDDAVGLHEIWHRATFAEELWIADDVEFGARLVIAADRVGDFLAGLYGDGALVNNDPILAGLENGGDFPGNLLDVRKIDAAVGLWWRGNSNKNDFGVVHSLFGVGRELEALCCHVAMNQFLKTWLVDRHLASQELIDFFFIVIDADDGVSDLSEACSRDETDVS